MHLFAGKPIKKTLLYLQIYENDLSDILPSMPPKFSKPRGRWIHAWNIKPTSDGQIVSLSHNLDKDSAYKILAL